MGNYGCARQSIACDARGTGQEQEAGLKSRFVLNHIGMAVPSIEKFLVEMGALYGGFSRGPLIENSRQRVREMFLTGEGTTIELLEPMGQPSPLDAFLKRHPQGAFIHAAFEVGELALALAELKAAGARTVVEPIPDVAFGGRRIAFVMMGGQIVELIEAPTMDE